MIVFVTTMARIESNDENEEYSKDEGSVFVRFRTRPPAEHLMDGKVSTILHEMFQKNYHRIPKSKFILIFGLNSDSQQYIDEI